MNQAYELFKLTCITLADEMFETDIVKERSFDFSCMEIACKMRDVHFGVVCDPMGTVHPVISPIAIIGPTEQACVFLFTEGAYDLYDEIPKGLSVRLVREWGSHDYQNRSLRKLFEALEDAVGRLRAADTK